MLKCQQHEGDDVRSITLIYFYLFSLSFLVDKIENETPVAAPPPKFSIQKIDSTSVLIEAVVPAEEPATFENVFDVYSKKDTTEDDWTKVCDRMK